MRHGRLIVATLLILGLQAAGARAGLPPIEHVFVVVLENKNYEQSFAETSPATYISRTLSSRGQVLEQYHGTSHSSLGNYLSMVSGQAPNPDTQSNCTHGFVDVFPGTPTVDGQVIGSGCVYPPAIETVADQLEVKGLSWKGYMQDIGNSPTASQTCRHPAIGAFDDTQSARVGDQYATRHNPFVYFHSIIDDEPGCAERVVGLDQLPDDLASAATTPNLAFIVPNLCDDGHDAPCVDGRPGGLVSADAFVANWAPQILASPAYAEGGLLVVTWDEGSGSAAACCDEPTGPNTAHPGGYGPGGGRTGAVLVSPFTEPATRNATPYNHYSLLRSIEDLFGLGHLGYAGQAGLAAFGDDVFNARPVADPPPPPTVAAPPAPATETGAAPATETPAARTTCSAGGTFLAGARLRGRTLVLTTSRAGRLKVRVDGRRVAAPKRLGACTTARIRLPRRHRVVRIAFGRERRTLRA